MLAPALFPRRVREDVRHVLLARVLGDNLVQQFLAQRLIRGVLARGLPRRCTRVLNVPRDREREG